MSASLLAISRFRYEPTDLELASAELGGCLELLAACAGYLGGDVGRALDDPASWTLNTRWANVGAYRRALSSYPVKLAMYPLMPRMLDEPSAFEVIVGDGATIPNEAQPRGAVP